MATTLPVKYYTSSMQGAPQLTNAWGDLTNMLDAVLVTGFNLKAITSLTSAGGIATADIAAGHLYQVDQVILIAGADQAEYNGEFRILTATANSFTYAITGTPASPATGDSISAKVAPLNFEIAFTGTNKRVYRSKNTLSNRPYLRVDNSLDPAYTTTYAKKGKVTMAEAMTDVDTFVAGAGRAPYDAANPTKNEVGTGSGTTAIDGWYKWYYARVEGNYSDSTAPAALNRNWVLVGDDRGFYFFTEHNGTYGRGVYAFTDFLSFRQGDGFSSILCASEAYGAANATHNTIEGTYYTGPNYGCGFHWSLSYLGKVLMRDHVQVGGTVRAGFCSLGTLNTQSVCGNNTGIPWPNGPDYSLILHPVYIKQENNQLRGKMPGWMWVHNDQPLTDLAVVDNVVGYPGRKFLLVGASTSTTGSGSNATRLAFDITGPWW